jgi:hypothetical protein
MKASDVGHGFVYVNALGSLTVHDLSRTVVGAGAIPGLRTRVKAHAITGSTLEFGAIGSLTAANITNSEIFAASINSLVVAGDKANGISGDFVKSNLGLSGAGVVAGKATLRSARITGMLKDSYLEVNGNVGAVRVDGAVDSTGIYLVSGDVGSFRAGAFTNSNLYAGFWPTNVNDPAAGGTFTPGFAIGSFRVTGYNGLTTPAFAGSTIAADIIGSVSLQSVQTTNNGTKFGLLAHTQIGAVNAGTPSLHYKKGQSLPAPIGDFEATII